MYNEDCGPNLYNCFSNFSKYDDYLKSNVISNDIKYEYININKYIKDEAN